MAMDRAEKLGLGAAVGGHVVLLGAMALGLFLSNEPLKKPQAISVSLVGEIAEVPESDDPRYVLLADPAATPLAPLLEALLMPRDAALENLWQKGPLSALSLGDAL